MLRSLAPCLIFALACAPSLASAAVEDPAAGACATLGEGDACTLPQPVNGDQGLEYEQSPGTCQRDECCEQDYSQGSPPKVTCGPCLTCQEGNPDGGKVGASAGGEAPRTSDDPPASSSNAKGCTIGGESPALAPLLALLCFARRRN